MGSGKKNVLILFLIAIICTGCVSFSNKNTINSSYEEWLDEIGLLNENGLKVDTYREADDYIEIVLRCDKSENQFTQFNELVQKHNEFVDKNVGYFENKSVYFIYEDAFLTYFSKPCEHYGNQYLNEISTNKETMSFLKINCSSMVNELEKQEIKFDTCLDYNEELMALYEKFVLSNYIILDYDQTKIKSQKFTFKLYASLNFLSETLWPGLYRNYVYESDYKDIVDSAFKLGVDKRKLIRRLFAPYHRNKELVKKIANHLGMN